jgi:DNA-binding GntR family transcriptional regulator
MSYTEQLPRRTAAAPVRHTERMTQTLLPAPIEHSDLNRKVYDHLRAAVLSGELRAGERLNLTTLSDQLGVSRSPVHQALTRLAAEGLVDVRSRRGYTVTPITTKALSEEYDVRLALELMAAELGVGTLSEEDLEQLWNALDETLETMAEDQPWDLHRYIQANQRFHQLMIDFARNDVMSSAYANLRVTLLMERVLSGWNSESLTSELSEQHLALYRAYESGDLEAAQTVIRAHVELGRQTVVQIVDAAGGTR